MRSLKILMCVATALITMSFESAAADYSRIEVQEKNGLEHELWPVQVGVTVPRNVSADSLILARVMEDGSLRKVEFQLLQEIASPGYDDRWKPLRGIKMVEIAFITAVPADASLEFRLYYSEPEADVAPAKESPSIAVEKGEGLERTVDTGVARFEFHEHSGQMITYNLAGTDFTPEMLRERNNSVHGDADLRTARNNIRHWNQHGEAPEDGLKCEEASGPLTWQTVRTGYVPHTDQQIEVAVSYAAFAGMPFIFTSSYIRFKSDWAVHGVRKNQLVFDRGFHTHGAYIGHDGRLAALKAFEPDDPAEHFGNLGVDPLPPDIPFIGMFHDTRGYGIGLVTLSRSNLRAGSIASTQDGGSYYRFLDSEIFGKGSPKNFFYLIRYEAAHGNHRMVVPAGSVFASQSAILTYPVGGKDEDDRFENLKKWTRALRNPPTVMTWFGK